MGSILVPWEEIDRAPDGRLEDMLLDGGMKPPEGLPEPQKRLLDLFLRGGRMVGGGACEWGSSCLVILLRLSLLGLPMSFPDQTGRESGGGVGAPHPHRVVLLMQERHQLVHGA